ncbi:hypothetical protein JCM33374_g3290 [Metschnikowia sp. JCM 33374]|nr:hypothetical protein JCM33374_g3290 [Metschnikowia sp. JCM 33374]
MAVSRLASKYFLPTLGAVGAAGLAFHFSGPKLWNEPSKTFTGGDWVDLKLKDSWHISPDTKHYVFELNSPEDVSGLVTASCLLAKYVTSKGNNVIRPYTPVSDPDQKGTIEFVIKTYPEGKFSKHVHELNNNDTVSFKGPIIKWKWEPNQFKKIILIGGGSGITPLYQLIHEISKNPNDNTKVDLYYGSKTQNDILLKKELDKIAAEHKDQINIHYFINQPEDGWKGHTGHIDKTFLKEHLAGPSADSKIFVCGPPPLYNAISGNKVSPTDQGEVTGILSELGYTKDHVFKF